MSDQLPLAVEGQGAFYAKIIKASDDFGFVLAPVLVPEEPDWQGDVISADEIEQAAHAYMEESQRGAYMHQQGLGDAEVMLVESSILRGDTIINGIALKAGTWLCAWKIYHPELRDLIRKGKITGLSIGAELWREPII